MTLNWKSGNKAKLVYIWLLFLLLSLCVHVHCIRRAIFRLEIDTLIANILVRFYIVCDIL